MNFRPMLNRLFSIVPFRLIFTICLAFCLIMGLGGSLLILLFHFTPFLWITVIGFELITLGLLFPVLIMLYRPYLSDMERMLTGEAWIHWRYSSEEWQSFKHQEARFNRRNYLGVALTMLVAGIVAILVGLVQPTSSDMRESWLWAGGMTIGIGLLVSLILFALSNSTVARNTDQGEVYISPMGIYQVPGGYQPLFGFGQVLRQIELKPGQPSYLRFDCLVRRSAYNSTTEDMAEIAIPVGREAEARDLIERFNLEILNRASAAV